jgi:hypothetical protein
MKVAVFWVIAPCNLVMEASGTSETSVNSYQSTRRSNPENSHLRNACFKPHEFTTWSEGKKKPRNPQSV